MYLARLNPKFLKRAFGRKSLAGEWVWSAVFFSILLLCCVSFLGGVSKVFPLDPWDETFYLWQGLSHRPFLDWGPLYGLFYRAYLPVTGDPISIYYLNFAFQAALLALLQFAILRRLNTRPLIAFLGGYWVLLAVFNLTSVPRINHFNTSWIYLSLIAVSWVRSPRIAAYLMALAALIGIYIRQDDIILSVGLLVYWVLLCLRTKEETLAKKRGALLVGAVSYAAIGLGLIFGIGSPFSQKRIWNAFADHFYWHDSDRLRQTVGTLDQTSLLKRVFGGASTLPQALMANPRELLTHVFDNAVRLRAQFFTTLFRHFPLRHESGIATLCLLACILVGLASSMSSRKKALATLEKLRVPRSAFQNLVLVTGMLLFLKSAWTSLLLFAAPRYYFEALCFSMLLIACLTDSLFRDYLKSRLLVIVPLALLLLCPNPNDWMPGNRFNDAFKKTVQFLRSSYYDRPLVFSSLGYPFYSGVGSASVDWDQLPSLANRKSMKAFGELMVQKGITVVILDKTIRPALARLGIGDSVDFFEKQPERFGFRNVFEIPDEVSVYFRNQT